METELERMQALFDALGVHYTIRPRCTWDADEYWRQPGRDYEAPVPEEDKTTVIGTIIEEHTGTEHHFDAEGAYLGAEHVSGEVGRGWRARR